MPRSGQRGEHLLWRIAASMPLWQAMLGVWRAPRRVLCSAVGESMRYYGGQDALLLHVHCTRYRGDSSGSGCLAGRTLPALDASCRS